MNPLTKRFAGRSIYQALQYLYAGTVLMTLSACGQREDFDHGDDLGPSRLGGGGGSRTIGSPTGGYEDEYITVTRRRLIPPQTFNIVRVQKIVEAESDTNWAIADLPFYTNTSPRGIEPEGSTPPTDNQWPIKFTYDYPQNNFQFKGARLVVDTKRDKSDTEGIYVDGVFSGIPPAANLNGITTRIPDPDYRIYEGTNGTGENKYYITSALEHYRRDEVNSFNLALSDLVSPSPLTAFNAVQDGDLRVVLGDDSPVFKAYLVIEGDTISTDELQCTDSTPFTFQNHLVHNDGNSIGEAAFSGAVGKPHEAWNNPTGYTASEFYFDTQMPKADSDDLTVSTAILRLYKAKIDASGCATIVVNGIGVSDTSCNRNAATSIVESWDENAANSAAWTDFLAGLTTTSTGATIDLDLIGLFGATKMKELLLQGKLNIALANSLVTKSAKMNYTNLTEAALGPSSDRAFQQPVDGPELIFSGSYTIQDCVVPDDPDSPMTEAGFIEPEYVEEYEEYEETILASEYYGEEVEDTSTYNDGVGPAIASLQVQDITSNSATIYWVTDEPSTSQVLYGVSGPSGSTPEDDRKVTFHKVELTGLSSYKYYRYQVVSKDKYGNQTTSEIAVFTTLR